MRKFLDFVVSNFTIGILLLISFLPLSLLYILSDLFYLLLYRVGKYRVKVVRQNLYNSFPTYNSEKLSGIEKGFYRFLADLIVESVKGFTIGRKSLNKRMSIENPEVYEELYKNRKSAIVVMGHCGNWEWLCRNVTLLIPNPVYVAYKPLSNPYFDKLMYRARSAFGSRPIPMAQVPRLLAEQKEPFLLILVSDQSPSDKNSSIWVQFLNQETAVLPGVEKLSSRYKLPVIFHEIKRIKRGYYSSRAQYIVEDGSNYAAGEISAMHSKVLDQKIIQQPETWLWSHRRWKLRK